MRSAWQIGPAALGCSMTSIDRQGLAREARRMALFGSLLVLAAMLSGLAFAGWSAHGASIFLVLAESGLSWCF